MADWFKKKTINTAGELRLPRHIAIIMDGNGRWAKKRGLPRSAGHVEGAASFRRIAIYCMDIGIEYLTVYAFSTENWSRPKEEVDGIMRLLAKYLMEVLEDLEKYKRRIKFLGDLEPLAPELKELIRTAEEKSSVYTEGQLNICLNYGSRHEIIQAIEAWKEDGCPALDEKSFSDYLYTRGIPDPDLLIRPGGEMRVSNYLLWQLAYTEFYYTDTLWPDFKESDIDKAIEAFRKRERRYGDIGKA